MRSSIKLLVALSVLTVTARTFAQHADADPGTLPAQISAQELAVQTDQGKQNWQAWLKLAVLLQDAGSYRESEDAYHHTISLLGDPDPLVVADVFDHMGTMYVESGQLSKAEPLERHALAIREHQHDDLGAGVSHMHLAMLLLGQNNLQPAEAEAQSAVSLLLPEYVHLPAISRATPEQKMTALIDLSVIQCESGASRNAIPGLQRALEIARESYPDKSIPVGYTEFLLGNAIWKTGKTKDAGKLMSEGVDSLRAELGWGHPKYLEVLRQYKNFLVDTRKHDKAQQITAELDRLDHSASSLLVASNQLAVQNPPK